MMNTLFYICDNLGFLRAMNLVKTALEIIKFAIPLALIVWICVDLFKNMINPDNKEGVKKIGVRLCASIIVFLLPTLIRGVLGLFDFITGDIDYSASRCYTNATPNCIAKINFYLNCDDQLENKKSACQEYRNCNSYVLDNSCNIGIELNDNSCSNINTFENQSDYEWNNFNQ